MRLLTLTAAVVTVAAAAPTAEAFSLSSISSLLSNYGLNVTLPDREISLPARAETAVTKALDKAESVLDRVFGEGGPLDGIDFPDIDFSSIDIPEINLPGFPEVELPDFDSADLDEILDNVQDKIDAAKAEAQAHIDAARDKIADRLESVIDRIEDKFPNSDLPGRLEDIIDRAHGVLDDILGDDDTASASTLLTSASLPPVAAQLLQTSAVSAAFYAQPATASASIPEPTAVVLGAAGVLLAGVARRRR